MRVPARSRRVLLATFPVAATSPLPWAVLLALVLALGWRRLPRLLRVAGLVVELALLMLMTPVGAGALERAVAAQLPVVGCGAPLPDTVVVIGGGYAHAPRTPNDYGALRLSALNRVFAAVALWRRLPHAEFVISGGAGRQIHEALPMANLALALGVAPRAVRIEDRSRTTWENARDVAALAPPVARRIWLVTSPEHLPRAVRAFQAFGFSVCPWPSRPLSGSRLTVGAFIPQGRSASRSAAAIHEWLGGFEYRWLAWRQARRRPPSAVHGHPLGSAPQPTAESVLRTPAPTRQTAQSRPRRLHAQIAHDPQRHVA